MDKVVLVGSSVVTLEPEHLDVSPEAPEGFFHSYYQSDI